MSTRKRTRDEAKLGHHSNISHGNASHSSVVHTNGNGVSNKGFSSLSYKVAKKERVLGHCAPAPFSDDPEAIISREQCDYSISITQEMARVGQAPRQVRIYSDGIYDLFHQGHARQLMQAKGFFPEVYLIVGVSNDVLTHQNKGRTVMDDNERYEAVRHCRYVDEVVRDAPWALDDDFLNYHKIDFVAHDDVPYTLGTDDDVYAHIKKRGMFLTTQRTDGVSTSDLVARIVKDYDLYVRRNLARGYKAKDMNVSFLNEKKFLLQNKMDELKDKGKLFVENFEGKRHGFIQKWEDKSREFINNFLDLFGRDGRINHFWQESKGKIRQALSPNNTPPGSPRSGSSSPAAKIFKRDSGHRFFDPDFSDEDDDEDDFDSSYSHLYGFDTRPSRYRHSPPDFNGLEATGGVPPSEPDVPIPSNPPLESDSIPAAEAV